MKKLLFLIALFIAVITLAGCKTTSTQTAEDRFAKADTNHDGKLSSEEASDYFVTTIFASRDQNYDGKLTWEEWNVPGSGRNKAGFDAADTDKDCSLSLDEALAYGRKRGVFKEQFREADTNNDGYVTREEAQVYYGSKEGSPR